MLSHSSGGKPKSKTCVLSGSNKYLVLNWPDYVDEGGEFALSWQVSSLYENGLLA